MSVPIVRSNRPRISKDTILTISGHIIKITSLIPACQIVAKVAEEILILVDTTNRNKELLKLLADRVEASSLWLLELNPKNPEKCKRAYKRYIAVLIEIKDYVMELRKPGKFSERFRKKVAMFFTAKDNQNLYTIYKARLDEAIGEFSLALNYDCNDLLHKYIESLSTISTGFTEQRRQLTEIQETIVLIRKGIEMPVSEEKIRLSPELIRKDDGEEPVMRGKNKQIKRQLYGSQEVAVKKINKNENKKSVNKYAFLMSKLSHCNSIEKFYGTLSINHELYIVTEWAEKGDLEDFLRSDQELSWLCRLMIADQVANALEFIHRAEIYHHDVRSRNVLLDKSLNAKLTGFDYSRLQKQSTTNNDQSLRWTAPEKLGESCLPYSNQCDIYGFSITLWEIAMRQKPFEEKDDDILVVDFVINGGRPTLFPTNAPEEYIELMKQGWSTNADTRPTIEVMREKLHKLTKQHQEDHDSSSSASVLPSINSNFASSISQPTTIPEQNEPLQDQPLQDQSLQDQHLQDQPLQDQPLQDQPLQDQLLQDQSLPPFEDLIKLHKQGRYTDAFPLFQQYAALSHEKSPIAKFYCGYYLYRGKSGINKDYSGAIKYLRQAADMGIAKAQTLYALACLEGNTTYDPENGIKYLKMAVKQEDRSALEMWAIILYNGEHDQDINQEEASKILKKAVSKGSKLKLFEDNQGDQENQDQHHNRKVNFLLIAVYIILIINLIILYDWLCHKLDQWFAIDLPLVTTELKKEL